MIRALLLTVMLADPCPPEEGPPASLFAALAPFQATLEGRVAALALPYLGEMMQSAFETPPYDPADLHVTRKGLQAFGYDVAIWGFLQGADLYSTDAAIRNGATEANPLIPTVESRVGLKTMASSLILGTQGWLRLRGHHGWASVLRWTMVAMYGWAIYTNGNNAGWW